VDAAGRAVLLALGVAALAACGGGGSKSLSHEEFVKQADAICADYNDRIAALGTPQGLGDLVAFAQKGRAIATEDVDKFAKLKPPKADAKGAADFVAAGRTVIDQLGKLEAAGRKSDFGAVQKIAAQGQANADQSRLIAKRLGLIECAKQG
jgi:hypothetical protein